MKMNQLLRSTALAGCLCLAALSSFGQATRTWVSGVGDDANPCSRTAPCKTFAGAISKTATGGEIDVLDPGGFGAVTITKAISIEAVGVVAGVLVSGTNGIVVAAGATDTVVLRGLTIEGLGTGLSGIKLTSGGALYVQDCTINNFQTGINVAPGSGQSRVFISRTAVRNNSNDGILFSASGSSISATLDAVTTEKNGGAGVEAKSAAGAGVDVSLESSTSANNAVGILSEGYGSTINLSNVTVFANTTGLSGSIGLGGNIVSFGNNRLTGNGYNGSPTNRVNQE
jgi:hypothetical protein